MQCISALLGAIALSATVSATPKSYSDPKLGAVASQRSECSKIGIDALKQGGNAADSVSLTPSCKNTSWGGVANRK